MERKLRCGGISSLEDVVKIWNSLPQRTVEPQSSRIFKRGIDRFRDIKDISGYGGSVGIMDQTTISLNG